MRSRRCAAGEGKWAVSYLRREPITVLNSSKQPITAAHVKGKRSNVKRRRKKKRKRKKLLEVFLPKFILLLFDEKVVLSKAPTGLNSVVFDLID